MSNKEKKVTKKTKKEETVEIKQPKKDLESVEIVNLETEQKSSIVLIIVIFVILLGTIIGMPYLRTFMNNIEESQKETVKPEDDKEKEEIEKEEAQYHILTTASFTYRGLVFNNFKLINENGYKISFDIASEQGEMNISDDYYLEIYNNGQMLLQRIKLVSEELITEEVVNLKYEVSPESYQGGHLIRVTQKTEDDYPSLVLTKNAEGMQQLSCVKDSQRYTYYFDEAQKLKKLEDIQTYTKGTDLQFYSSLLIQKQNEVAQLNNQNGVTSTLVESTDSFLVNTQTDLSVANEEVENDYYYPLDTLAKRIDFEMEAMMFNCD